MSMVTEMQLHYLEKAAERDIERGDTGSQGGMNVVYSLVRCGMFEQIPERKAWRITEAGRRALRLSLT